MRSVTLITLSIIIVALIFVQSRFVYAATDSVNVNLTVSAGTTNQSPPPPLPPSPLPIQENTQALCSNFSDDDGDGLIDFDDPDCALFVPLIELSITNVVSQPGTSTSKITWKTNLSAVSTISWGLSTDYELGSSVEGQASTTHAFIISNLLSNTTYYFRIKAYEQVNPTNTNQVTNQTFTTLTGQDSTPPSSPINFSATYNQANQVINLSWTNPIDQDFDVVRIMRSTSFYPYDENDGVFIYEGSGTSMQDLDFLPGNTYYYSIFSKDFAGNWSAGAIDFTVVPQTVPECIGSSCEPTQTEIADGGGGGSNATSTKECIGSGCEQIPFEPPLIVDPQIKKLVFKFTQNGLVSYFSDKSTVKVDGNYPFKVSVDYGDLPEVLKTIAVTLHHPKDKQKIFSFILRADSQMTEYSATIAPLVDRGVYDVSITILDHKNQGLRRLNGELNVSEGNFANAKTINTLKNIVSPIGQTVGVVAGVSEAVIVATNIRSFYDLYLVLSRLVAAFLGFLGFRRKSRPWGTVYDSVTKRPLDPAYVSVTENNGEEKSGAITDLDGRYGFFLPKGVYKLFANKTHYEFPSKKLAGKSYDELYADLYFGEPISTEEGQIIDRNIPMDPVGFDWNEFEKNKKGLYVLYSRREKIKTAIFNTIYVFGLASTVFALVFSPSPINLTIMAVYILMFLFQFLWGKRHRATSIFYKDEKNPLAFAIIRVFTSELSEQVKAVVADEYGRFYLLISPGSYYITVDVKEVDGSYKRIYKSDIMKLEDGVLPKNIVIA